MKKTYIRPSVSVELMEMDGQLLNATSSITMDDTPATGDALERDDAVDFVFGNNNIFLEVLK